MALTPHIINLDFRKDRLDHITQELEKVKTFKPMERFSAIRHENGTIGCWLSHQTLVKQAKENNEDMILVLEDDCKLADDFDERFPIILDWLTKHKNDWDIFNGGPSYISGNHVVERSPKIGQVNCLMTNFIIYNSSSYEKICNVDDYSIPIDNFINKHLRQFVTYPVLARQIPSQSDAQIGYRDYNKEFDAAEKHLRGMFGV